MQSLLDTATLVRQPLAPAPTLLPADQFEQAAAAWLDLVYSADERALQQCFRGFGQQKVNFLSFPQQALTELVSAVGVHLIKARFLVLPDAATGAPHFSLALFAEDTRGKRLSAYYLADAYWLAAQDPALAPAPTAPATPSAVGKQVPAVLARQWAQHWAQAPQAETAMFDCAHGPLHGYDFVLGDFLAPLFTLTGQETQVQLRLNLCLHTYAKPSDERTDTMGLTLQLQGHNQIGAFWGDVFDLSTPCPPGSVSSGE